jgi:hypothetical protein
MWLAVFLPLSLFAFSAFSAANTLKISVLKEYAPEFDKLFNILITGNSIATAGLIGPDLNLLFLMNRDEYFQLILNHPHELLVPIAMVSLIADDQSECSIKGLVRCHLQPKTLRESDYSVMIDISMQKTAELIERTAFDYDLSIPDRVETIGHFIKCYSKLFQLLKNQSETSVTFKAEQRIFQENMNLWQEIFLLPTKERDMLFQTNPRRIISKYLISLENEIETEKNYCIPLTEECKLRNLVKKILEMPPSKFLPILATKRPRSLCLFLFFGFVLSECSFRNYEFTLTYSRMAFMILIRPSFNKKFNAYLNYNDVSGKSAKVILNRLSRLAEKN